MSVRIKAAVSFCITLLYITFPCLVTADQAKTIKEPHTYRTSNYKSEVPLTVSGAKVIETAQELHNFLQKNPDSVLLDVYPAPRKPDNLPADDIWIEPKRKTLPSAIWLANVGFGTLPQELDILLQKQLKQLTADNNQSAVIIFCEPACWHSWNAAKRAVSYGYPNIYWYRQGVTGWVKAHFPVKTKHPVRP